MFNKIALALVAATVLTAPALAQGGPVSSKAPGVVAPAATATAPALKTRAVAAAPMKAIKRTAKVKRHTARHTTRHAHVKHLRKIKHVRAARSGMRSPTSVAHAKSVTRTRVN